MSATTVYDVNIRYQTEDRASRGLEAIGRSAQAAERSTLGLRDALTTLGVTISGGMLLAGAKHAFIDFNNQVEQSKVGIASITKMFHKDMTFDKALTRADAFFGFYQDAAKKSTATTMDFLDMHKMVAPALERAGASVADFKAIVSGATTSSQIFGERADVVGLDIKQMLMGTISARDRVANTLIAMQNMTQEQFNAKAKANPQFALDFLKKAFTDGSLNEARKKLEHTFEGALSTLKDNVQIGLGEAGKGLFVAMSKELNAINEWIDKNPQKLALWGEQLGRHLKDGFGAVKSAVQFLIDHKDLLIGIGEVWVASKVMGMALPGGSGLGSGFGGMLGGLTGTNMRTGELTRGMAGGYNNFRAMMSGPGMFMGAHQSAMSQVGTRDALMNALGGGALGLAFSKMTGDTDKMSQGVTTVASALATLPGPIGLVGAGLVGLQLILNEFEKDHKKQMEYAGDAEGLRAAMKGSQATFITYLKRFDAIDKDMQFNPAKFQAGAKRLPGLGVGEAEGWTRFAGKMFRDISNNKDAQYEIAAQMGLVPRVLPRGKFDEDENKRAKAAKTNVNVTVHKIEVASDDPDRFAFRLGKAFKRMGQNPTSAADAIRDS